MSEIIFIYEGSNISIQCNKNQKLKDICNNLSLKINEDINSLLFLYGGNKLNLDKTLNEITKENKINILVYKMEDKISSESGSIINNKILEELLLLNNNINNTFEGLKNNIELIMKEIKLRRDINYVYNQLNIIYIIINNLYKDINKMNIQLNQIKFNNNQKSKIMDNTTILNNNIFDETNYHQTSIPEVDIKPSVNAAPIFSNGFDNSNLIPVETTQKTQNIDLGVYPVNLESIQIVNNNQINNNGFDSTNLQSIPVIDPIPIVNTGIVLDNLKTVNSPVQAIYPTYYKNQVDIPKSTPIKTVAVPIPVNRNIDVPKLVPVRPVVAPLHVTQKLDYPEPIPIKPKAVPLHVTQKLDYPQHIPIKPKAIPLHVTQMLDDEDDF